MYDIYPEISLLNYNNNDYNEVELSIDFYLEKILKDYLYKISHDYNSDVLGIKKAYKISLLTEDQFKTINWKNNFKDSFFKINIHSQITKNHVF